MSFKMPDNAMTIGFQILGAVTLLMQDADAAFDGKPGSGDKKKAWLMKAAAEAIKTQDLIKADLMTTAQEAAVLDSVDKGVEFIFSAVETAKLFKTPATPLVK